MKTNLKYIITGMVVGLMVVVANPGFGAKITPKPTVNSDEHQGILAVRSVKAAVVSVVGTTQEVLAPVDSSAGSGFIISNDGYIVTNSHVVQDAQAQYSVIFIDGKKFPVRVVGVDKLTDIALLKIEANGLATVKFGNSDSLETGQSVFAIGNSLGKYQNSVTRGVVSGLGRDVSIGSVNDPRPRFQNLIQTDASINPGNSGGPLVNLSGEVIGMNTLIDPSGRGLGFAIPVNSIKQSVEQIRSTGKTTRPYLGVNFVTINPTVKALKGLPVDNGALVVAVVVGSSAFNAGIVAGDIILQISSEVITAQNEMDKIIAKYQAGNQVMLKIIRGGQNLDFPVILGEYK